MVAIVWLFPAVRFQMCPQITCPRGCIVTLVTFVWLFSTVHFQMLPQMACLRRCKVTLVTFVWLFSIILPDSHSCILQTKFIKIFFGGGDLSNGGWRCAGMKWYITCICLVFLSRMSVNGFSNCLHWQMHNYIGCICLAFLHCVFPNVPSKHGTIKINVSNWKTCHKKMHSHIDCTCLTFSTVCLQMHPQNTYPRG